MKKGILTSVGLIAALVVMAAFAVPKVLQIQELNERSLKLDEELKKLRYQNQQLETELRLLRDDPVYLERVARQKFNKAKEGEIVYKVVREQGAKGSE